ncbi:MAG: NAD(P)-dependent alcohol dehydrogenase [Thermoplasmata archaeon]|nr:MAG: NAD(P)-dependent alcohol dehydrogenase [Thermoplasmata archaeon]
MKAVVCKRYGSPMKVLKLKEAPKPTPRDNEVLVKIHAASVNAADVEILRGAWTARMTGPLRPRSRIPGSDVAGVVESVGKNVTKFKPGDEVFGDTFMKGFGAFAEYKSAPEKELYIKPKGMTFEQASCYPQSGIIALQGLRNKHPIKPGQTVLINGAGGGMGTFAVQIAKHYGAEVTAVDHTSKIDMLHSIGADHVMDYTKEDYTKTGKTYNLILDVVAGRKVKDYERALSDYGNFVIVGGSRATIFKVIFLGPIVTRKSNKKMGLNDWSSDKNEDMRFLMELFEAGKVKPVIDKHYPLREVPEAYRYLEEGHVKGKLVITMGHDNKT